jgi:glycogen debranching enzyme
MIMSILAEKFGDDYNYYNDLAGKVYKSFNEKFYCEETGCLYDTVDPYDKSVRPNQVWVLSLPFKILAKEKAVSVFNVIERELYNKYGLRSLSPNDPRFKPRYEGKLFDRDMAYHMGTTWGFLIGGYLDAYRYIHGDSEEVTNKINDLVHVFREHLNEGCLNGIAEIFDGDIASRTRGCYNQAWSVGELLRAYFENVLMEK